MKELVINSGGRRLFNEDLNSLQDHLKSVQEIFKSEEPFILSGMQYSLVSGSTYDISEGYVWLGNKIRYFSGATNVNLSIEQYINTSDTTSSRLYEDNNQRIALEDFGTTLSSSEIDSTNSLRIDQIDDTRRYWENVLGDKFLSLDSSKTQVILSNISAQGSITSTGTISTSGTVSAAQLSSSSLSCGTGSISQLSTNTLATNMLTVNSLATFASSIKASVYLAGNDSGAVINNDGSISTDRVTSDSIQAEAVDTAELADEAVTTPKIDNGAVEHEKLATDSVYGDKIKDDAITTGKIYDGAVTTAKIDNNAITIDKMANNSVGNNQLTNSSVTNNKIQSGTIESSKLSFDHLEVVKTGSGSFTTQYTSDFVSGSISGWGSIPEDEYTVIIEVEVETSSSGGSGSFSAELFLKSTTSFRIRVSQIKPITVGSNSGNYRYTVVRIKS